MKKVQITLDVTLDERVLDNVPGAVKRLAAALENFCESRKLVKKAIATIKEEA